MDKPVVLGLIVGTAVMSFGVGYILGQNNIVNRVGEVLTREAVYYLAYTDHFE